MINLWKTKKDFGFILIDKETGPTSHDIIYKLRKITGIKKIGHAGTLDPFASGLMIVAIDRRATREIEKFVKLDKKYLADIILGKETDTYDRDGKTISSYSGEKIPKQRIKEVVLKIKDQTEQIPPMYSAKKINGKKLYELARKNIEIERKSQSIKIFCIKIKKYNWPELQLDIHCSSGTYIRTIANDLGKELGCGAYLKELRRTAIKKYQVEKAKKIKEINSNNWKKYLFNI